MTARYTMDQISAFLYDALNEENLSAQQIYETIIETVAEHTEYLQIQYEKSQHLFDLLKGTAKPYETPWNKFIEENKDGFLSKERESNFPNENDCIPPWGHSGTDHEKCTYGDGFWRPPQKKDSVIKWSLPVEEAEDGEYYITFPEDLLEASKLVPGDNIEWVKMTENSYLLRKVE